MRDMTPKPGGMRRILVLGCLGIAVPIVVLALWLTLALFPGFGGIDSAHHPFRSQRAKERYLELYDRRAQLWPVPSESTTVNTSYGPTFVRVSGPRAGPPLVLLHGAGGSSLQWIPNVAALSERYRTYALDGIYDFGRSVYKRKLETAAHFVAWLDETFDALNLESEINLVGLSYGGWQASQYALQHPARLRRIVLVAPAGTVLPISGDWIARASLSVIPHPYFTRRFLVWLLSDWANESDESRRMLEEEASAIYTAIRSFKLKRLVNPSVLTNREWRTLSTPTLFLVGEHEKLYPPDRAIQRLAETAPQIESVLVPGAGHDLTVVRADPVNQLILEFLDRR